MSRALTSEHQESINTVRQFISTSCNFDIGELGCDSVSKGVFEGVRIISGFQMGELEAIRTQIQDVIKPTMELLGIDDQHVGLANINLDFLQGMLLLFRSIK